MIERDDYGPRWTPEADANARLIAAAPEMLDLVKWCADQDCNCLDEGCHCTLTDPCCEPVKARALLARMGGGNA